MKIELKKVSFSERMSKETNCFTADIYVDGKKVGYAENRGEGGNTDCRPYTKEQGVVLAKADEYCKTLPPITCVELDFTYKQNLESVVDDLLTKWLVERDAKKLEKKVEKDCKQGICYKSENGYRIVTWKTHTLEDLLKFEKGREAVKKSLQGLEQRGEVVLNKNIPQELYS